MSNPTFHGVIPPVVTPLNADGSVDHASYERLIEKLLAAGVHGLFILGSSGEVAYLADAARKEVMETAVRVVAGRVPVMAGVIDISTNRVIDEIRVAEAAGVDAVVATAPLYIRTSLPEIETHFREIAAATSLPVFAYDVPVCVQVKLDLGMLMRLGSEGVIAGVKDSSGDDVGFRRLVAANRAAGSPMALFTGHEVVVDGMLLLGADGVVPGLGNVDPEGYVRLWDLAQAGKWEDARLEQDRLAALFEIVFQATGLSGGAGGVGSFKTSLNLMGVIDHNRMSTPAGAFVGENVTKVAAVLTASGMTLA